jgi:LysR family nitrogen assimilation transcriptional regulator
VAQPALGAQIRLLEEELGVQLLSRHSRGVRVTQAGEVLYGRAVGILRDVDLARQDVMACGDVVQESLRLGITPGITNVLRGDILVSARQAIPSVRLSFMEEMSYVLADAVMRDDVDMALAYEVLDRPGLRRTPLLEEELICIVSPNAPFLPASLQPDDEYIEFAEILNCPLVLGGERDSARRLVENAAQQLGRAYHVPFEASSISMMKSIVIKGEAACVMPHGAVIDEQRAGSLKVLRIAGPTLCRTLYLIEQTKRQPLRADGAVRQFIYAMTERFAVAEGHLIHRTWPHEEPMLSS